MRINDLAIYLVVVLPFFQKTSQKGFFNAKTAFYLNFLSLLIFFVLLVDFLDL